MEEIKQRRSLSAQEWARVMRRFAASGMTVSAFCRAQSLNEGSFYRWRSRMTAQPMNRQVAAQTSRPNGFVDLGALHAASASTSTSPGTGALDLRLELGGGLSLHLVRR